MKTIKILQIFVVILVFIVIGVLVRKKTYEPFAVRKLCVVDCSRPPKPPAVPWAPDPFLPEKLEAAKKELADAQSTIRQRDAAIAAQQAAAAAAAESARQAAAAAAAREAAAREAARQAAERQAAAERLAAEERRQKEQAEADRRAAEEARLWYNIATKGNWVWDNWLANAGIKANTVSISSAGPETLAISTSSFQRYERLVGQTEWGLKSGGLKQFSILSNTEAVGVGTDDNVWRWKNNGWNKIGDFARWTSIGNDQTIWITSTKDYDEAAGGANIWMNDGNGWNQIGGRLNMVSAANRNNVWGINSYGGIFRWDGNTWNRIPSEFNDVAVSASGKVVAAIKADQSIWVWNGSTWLRVPGGLTRIACNDNYLIGCNADGNVFTLKLTP